MESAVVDEADGSGGGGKGGLVNISTGLSLEDLSAITEVEAVAAAVEAAGFPSSTRPLFFLSRTPNCGGFSCLCLRRMCRFKESSEPYRFPQPGRGHRNLRSISDAFLLTRLDDCVMEGIMETGPPGVGKASSMAPSTELRKLGGGRCLMGTTWAGYCRGLLLGRPALERRFFSLPKAPNGPDEGTVDAEEGSDDSESSDDMDIFFRTTDLFTAACVF